MTTARNSRVLGTIPLLLIVVLFCPFARAKVIYVDDDVTGANSGTSWIDAYIFLQDALAEAIYAEKPVEIRVAQGICKLCADMILEVVNGHIRSKQTVRHGQILWTTVSIDDRPGWSQKIADTDLVRYFWMPAQLRTFSHASMGSILARLDCVRLFECAIRHMSKVVC